MESIPEAAEGHIMVSQHQATKTQPTVKAKTAPMSIKQRLFIEIGKK